MYYVNAIQKQLFLKRNIINSIAANERKGQTGQAIMV
jgi:hypothetical protein